MAPVKRQAYEADFKLKAISHAVEHGNRAAAKEFNINVSMVRKWRKQEDDLRQVKKTKKSFRGNKKARWPKLEDNIEQRTAGRSVSTVSIRLKATTVARDMKINDFRGSPSWYFRFMKRRNLRLLSNNNETDSNNDKRDPGMLDAEISQLLNSDTSEDEEFVEEECTEKPKMSNDNSTTRCYVMNQRKTQKVKTEEDSSTFSSQYNSLSQPTVAKFKKKTTEQFENQSLEKKAQIISTQPAPRQKQVLAPPIQVAAAKPKPVEKPRPREKRMFVISDHQHCVMSNLSSLWRCGKLCDAGIGNGKSTIMVHKVVLSAVCPKLLSVFSTDMLSQTFLEVNFPEEVSTEALNAFAEYMYNGILDLDPVILEQLKIIARRLDMNEFEQLCDSHLPNHIHQPAAAAAASFADFPMIQATMPISAMSSLGPTISSTSIQSAPSFATHVINIKQENFDVELAQIQNDAAAMFAQESEVVSLASNKSRNDAGFVICSNIKTEPIGPEDDRYGRVSNSSINQTFTSTTSSSLSSLATDSAPISSVSKSFTKYPIPFLRSTNIKSTTLKRSRCYEVPLVSNLTPEPIIVQRMHSQTNCINKNPPKIPSPTSNSLSSVTDFATSSNNTVYPVRLFTARGDNLPLMETHLSDVMSINSPPD